MNIYFVSNIVILTVLFSVTTSTNQNENETPREGSIIKNTKQWQKDPGIRNMSLTENPKLRRIAKEYSIIKTRDSPKVNRSSGLSNKHGNTTTHHRNHEIRKQQTMDREYWKVLIIVVCTVAASVEVLIVVCILIYWKEIRWAVRKFKCPWSQGRTLLPSTDSSPDLTEEFTVVRDDTEPLFQGSSQVWPSDKTTDIEDVAIYPVMSADVSYKQDCKKIIENFKIYYNGRIFVKSL